MQVPQFQFNANQYEPNQGFGIHPPAQKIPFTLTNTEIKDTTDKTGSYLSVEFTTPLGTFRNIYNIRNNSPKAVEIAYGQLSALCRAVNIFQIDGANECAALRGGKGLADIGYQKGEEPDPAYPDRKGYTELKRVYDLAGNDPSKPGQVQQPQQAANGFQQPQPQVQPQPLQQQPGGSWGQPNQVPQQSPQPNPATQGQPQGQAWQPGGNAPGGAAPPWGAR